MVCRMAAIMEFVEHDSSKCTRLIAMSCHASYSTFSNVLTCHDIASLDLEEKKARSSRVLSVEAIRRRGQSSCATPPDRRFRSRAAYLQVYGRHEWDKIGVLLVEIRGVAQECCFIISILFRLRLSETYEGSSDAEMDGPRIWKRIFAHDTTPDLGI
jgi:hypothetical protein